MKAIKLLTVFALFFTALNFTSCASEDEPVDPHVYDVVLPTVTTTAVSGITGLTAISGGTVTSDGNGTVISRGVVWSTSVNPTIANAKTVDGTGTGSYLQTW